MTTNRLVEAINWELGSGAEICTAIAYGIHDCGMCTAKVCSREDRQEDKRQSRGGGR